MTRLELSQLTKQYQPIFAALDKLSRAVVFSCANTQKAHLVASLGVPALYVAPDERVETVCKTLEQLGMRAAILPAHFDLLIHRLNANLSVVSARIDALLKFALGELDALVLSPKALMQYVPQKDLLLS